MKLEAIPQWLSAWSAAGGGWALPAGRAVLIRPQPHACVPDMLCNDAELDRLAKQISGPGERDAVEAHLQIHGGNYVA